jgi:hypothetical protein
LNGIDLRFDPGVQDVLFPDLVRERFDRVALDKSNHAAADTGACASSIQNARSSLGRFKHGNHFPGDNFL